MRLKLTVTRHDQPAVDIVVTADAGVTVGALASALAERDPRGAARFSQPGLRTGEGTTSRFLPSDVTLAEAGVTGGSRLALVEASTAYAAESAPDTAATLLAVSGPVAGQQWSLRVGANHVGRDRGNDVVVNDPLVSKRHARINVTDVVEILDLGSANGVVRGDDLIERAVLRSEDEVVLGDTTLRVLHAATSTRDATGTGLLHHRSPVLDVRWVGSEHETPEPPGPPERPKITPVPLLIPLVLGGVMYLVTRNLVSILFVAFGPAMLIGNIIERRVLGRREHVAAVAAFRQALSSLDTVLVEERRQEAETRRAEHPATAALVEAARLRQPLLWSGRPDRRGFLEVSLGRADMPSRGTVKLPTRPAADASLGAELLDLQQRHGTVPDVPVAAALREVGNVGVAGPRQESLATGRALVAQMVTRHSPAEVVLAAVVPSSRAADWDWLKWLPHTSSDHSPVEGAHLAATAADATRLLDGLEAALEQRQDQQLPVVVLLVEDGAPVDRSRLVRLAERGPALGVHLLWVAASVAALPAACRAYVEHDPTNRNSAEVGFVVSGTRVASVDVEQLDADAAHRLARDLAPVQDSGARVEDQSDLPRSVALLALLGTGTDTVEAVLDRWATGGSLPGAEAQETRTSLRAVVGTGSSGAPFALDLREHGPHALVGGTTGAGKSEFLQSWVLAMALEHSPARVTFLFVDYKGGAAFGALTELPHCVGMVTDLSPHLVRRALTSLHAELRHREEVLREHKAKDLMDLERRAPQVAPPSLIIVVDEFAALVNEVPEFVDGVVDVAQRGRSLGLHLVLATQRPAGVIKDNLRANTNLRVALRMADEADSDDVVGSPAAASFDPSIPGRAMVKLGPGRLSSFQAGYVGGWTSDKAESPSLDVAGHVFGSVTDWPRPPAQDVKQVDRSAPTDLERLVAAVRGAHESSELPLPRRPWLDSLAPAYDLARTSQSRRDDELRYGVLDEPSRQRQTHVAFRPDEDGNMAVYGTGGSGKTTVLRTLAVLAGVGVRGGPCHVYGLDFGTRGLRALEVLPHVGAIVSGDDEERLTRLLTWLRELIDERALRYASAQASTVTQYREITGRLYEPRVLLLVDGVSAFRAAYETGLTARWWDLFLAVAADGRPVGVHVVLTADRAGALPMSLGASVQHRLVLRLTDDGQDYALLGVPDGALTGASPPGRGVVEAKEVQVAVLGGSPNTALQAVALGRLGEELKSLRKDLAPPRLVGRLPERVRLADLPDTDEDGLPVLGIASNSLEPIGFMPTGPLLVVGPPQSGRTSALAALALSFHRARPGSTLLLMSPARSALGGLLPVTERADEPETVATLAKQLLERLAEGLDPARVVVVVENLADFLNTAAEGALLDLIKACRASGVLVLADGEPAAVSSSYPLLATVKAVRHGLVLQPDQNDGDLLFKTALPRINRAAFPPGRGFLLRGGKAVRLQVALPELEDASS